MDIVRYGLWVWTAVLFVGGIIPQFHAQIWWLRAWTYARLQMLVLSVVTITVSVLGLGTRTLDAKLILLAAIIVIALCLRDVLRFTPLWPKQTALINDEPHIPIKMLVGNVLQDNDQADGLLQSIAKTDPDMVFLCETNNEWRKRLSPLEERYPFTHLLPLEDYNGMLFYSKFPIKNVDERYLVQSHIPSLRIDLDIGADDPLRIYGVHPRPPRPEDDTADLDHELIHVAKEVRDHDGPTIVTGDLNDVGWSRTTKVFLKTSGMKDPRRGRALVNSYNAKNPIVRWPLDHIFHTDHFGLIDIQRMPKFGSDHFPVFIALGLRHAANP